MVWTIWRIRFDSRLCRTSATTIGAGNTMTVWIAVRISVFFTALRNSGSPLKTMEKFSKPLHRLRPTPR
jgi:hypothetical protein